MQSVAAPCIPARTRSRRDRERMVAEQIAARDVRDPRVLAAMRDVPRHLFVPPDAFSGRLTHDRPLPIGHDQTISQPYIVALMTELARPGPAIACSKSEPDRDIRPRCCRGSSRMSTPSRSSSPWRAAPKSA